MNNLTFKVFLQAFINTSAGVIMSPAAATRFLMREQNPSIVFLRYKLSLDNYNAFSTAMTISKRQATCRRWL